MSFFDRSANSSQSTDDIGNVAAAVFRVSCHIGISGNQFLAQPKDLINQYARILRNIDSRLLP